jgi:hypothetical protein
LTSLSIRPWYIVAANFAVKLNDDPLGWTLADGAFQAGDDPLTIADGRRAVAIVLRRTGRPAMARELLTRAIHDIEPQGCASPDRLSMYGTLLEVAAYTAVVLAKRAPTDSRGRGRIGRLGVGPCARPRARLRAAPT